MHSHFKIRISQMMKTGHRTLLLSADEMSKENWRPIRTSFIQELIVFRLETENVGK
jgi:hypothetical protein